MKDKTICRIFCEIARQAMAADFEIILEKGKDTSKSIEFLTKSEMDVDSLRLHVFKPNDENVAEGEHGI